MKKTDVSDKLDNVLSDYTEGVATEKDMVQVAHEVNKYLFYNPRPDDVINREQNNEILYYELDRYKR